MDKKIVFITGISRGIGLEIAKCFVNDGYYVIGTSRSPFSINEELNSENCIHFSIDVTDRNKISSCLDELKKINKIPNVLINKSVINRPVPEDIEPFKIPIKKTINANLNFDQILRFKSFEEIPNSDLLKLYTANKTEKTPNAK